LVCIEGNYAYATLTAVYAVWYISIHVANALWSRTKPLASRQAHNTSLTATERAAHRYGDCASNYVALADQRSDMCGGGRLFE
jgi:hypothetical protein